MAKYFGGGSRCRITTPLDPLVDDRLCKYFALLSINLSTFALFNICIFHVALIF